MAKIRISKRTVDALKPTDRAFIVYDEELSGFGVRVAPSKIKTYFCEFRPGTGGRGVRSVRLALGRHGDPLTADQARKLARDKLAEARRGDDPAAQRRQEREAKTLKQVADLWMVEAVEPKLSKKTIALYKSFLKCHLSPEIANKKLQLVCEADIDRLHRAIGQKRKATANRMCAMLSALFNFSIRQRFVPKGFVNPVGGLDRYKEEARERFLSTEELQRLGAVLREAETVGIPWKPDPDKKTKHAPKPENRLEICSPHVTGAIRLLLFTGCRLREILHLRWSDVDFERGILFLPKTKTGKRAVVLNAPALAVLASLPKASEFVIAGADPEKPRSDLKRPWDRFTDAANLPGLRLHDLRHSFASVGAGGGMGLPIVGKLLGHTQVSTTARYAHLADDPLRAASERIGGAIEAAMHGKPLAEVIQLAGIRKQA